MPDPRTGVTGISDATRFTEAAHMNPVACERPGPYLVLMGYPTRYPGTCPSCGTHREVSGTYEAVVCPRCDEWQSPLCGQCPLCRDRPARPSQAAVLDLAPHERDADYNLDLDDDEELLRRVVMPVVRGTLPDGAVRTVEIVKEPGWPEEHWPADLPLPESVYCRVTLITGEQEMIFLGPNGHVYPEALAERFADQVEDCWSESSTGWGQQVRAEYHVPPSRSATAPE